MSVIPVDLAPYIEGYPVVSTRRIFGQWIYTDGTGVEVPPTITYLGGPYYINTTKVTVFPKQQIAVTLAASTEGTTGLWYADVLVSDDPDVIGDVAVRISHPILPGGSITVLVPSGTEPLNVANAARVTGTPGGLVAVSGLSAYEVAVENGFVGTEDEWLASLAGGQGITSEVVEDIVGSLIVAGSGITKTYNDTSNTLTISATGTPLDTEAVQDIIGSTVVAGSGVSIAYNDAAGTVTISATGGGSLDAEAVRDTIGAALVGSGLITVTVNDAGDTITISTTATANSTDTFLRARANHTGSQAPNSLALTASDRIVGRVTSGAGTGEELTPVQIRTMINVDDGATIHINAWRIYDGSSWPPRNPELSVDEPAFCDSFFYPDAPIPTGNQRNDKWFISPESPHLP